MYEQHDNADLIAPRFSRRSYLHENLQFPLPNARFVQIPWSSSYKCGVHSKRALWTVRCMSGVVLVLLAKDSLGGREDSA